MNAYLEAAVDEGVVDDLVGSEGDLGVMLCVHVAINPGHFVHEEVHEEEDEVVCPQADTHPADKLCGIQERRQNLGISPRLSQGTTKCYKLNGGYNIITRF